MKRNLRFWLMLSFVAGMLGGVIESLGLIGFIGIVNIVWFIPPILGFISIARVWTHQYLAVISYALAILSALEFLYGVASLPSLFGMHFGNF